MFSRGNDGRADAAPGTDTAQQSLSDFLNAPSGHAPPAGANEITPHLADPTAQSGVGFEADATPRTGRSDDTAPLPRSAEAKRNRDYGHRTAPRADGVSVIGHDLAIFGNDLRIVSHGKIQIEGHVRGEVYGDEIVIGDEGSVSGTLGASQVVVHGRVSGTVRARDVHLMAGAIVDASLHHGQLTLEPGAVFEGHAYRPTDGQSLAPNIEQLVAEGTSNEASQPPTRQPETGPPVPAILAAE